MTVINCLNTLETSGFIERSADGEDKRKTYYRAIKGKSFIQIGQDFGLNAELSTTEIGQKTVPIGVIHQEIGQEVFHKGQKIVSAQLLYDNYNTVVTIDTELDIDTDIDNIQTEIINKHSLVSEPKQGESSGSVLESMTVPELVAKCFEKFYTHYPRRENRKDADKAYKRAFKNLRDKKRIVRLAQAILSGLSAAVAGWTQAGTEKRFIPLPATWLNGERWRNEPDPPPGAPDENDLLGGDTA